MIAFETRLSTSWASRAASPEIARNLGGRDLELDAGRLGARARRFDRLKHKPLQVDATPLELQLAALQPRGEKKVGDEPEEPLGVTVDDPEVGALLVVVLVLEHQFHVARDRRERRPELVRDVRHELVLQGVELDELLVLVREQLLRLLGLAASESLGASRSFDRAHEPGES